MHEIVQDRESLPTCEQLPRPCQLCKRLAVLICGLVATDSATMGQLTTAVEALAIQQGQKGESITPRLQRMLQDAPLGPSLLPVFFCPLLPQLPRPYLLSRAAGAGSNESHRGRFRVVVVMRRWALLVSFRCKTLAGAESRL